MSIPYTAVAVADALPHPVDQAVEVLRSHQGKCPEDEAPFLQSIATTFETGQKVVIDNNSDSSLEMAGRVLRCMVITAAIIPLLREHGAERIKRVLLGVGIYVKASVPDHPVWKQITDWIENAEAAGVDYELPDASEASRSDRASAMTNLVLRQLVGASDWNQLITATVQAGMIAHYIVNNDVAESEPTIH